MQEIARKALLPYSTQGNTGNSYEIYATFNLLRRMGLTNDEIASLIPLIEQINEKNSKSKDKINTILQTIITMPVGEGLMFDGKRVKDLRNVTQNDNDGKTGDVICVLEDDTEKSISIFQGKIKKNGDIEKCLSNPSCTRLGCENKEIQEFKQIAEYSVPAYKLEMANKYGADEAKWPRKPSDAAISATSKVAKITCDVFNALPDDIKLFRMKDILRVDIDKPADILCIVNDKCTKIQLFTVNRIKDNLLWSPRLVVVGYWLNMYLGDIQIGRIQVKFNNGIWHNGKTSSLTSSWNATVTMNSVFDLTKL